MIYSNSVCAARSNFEGGPSALAAGITGRTPRYGFHLPEQRRATLRVVVDFTPGTLNEWGALGGVIGRLAGNYWAVPVIEGGEGVPKSDQLKHFGAAMASFGSTALFHWVGITPEARQLSDVAAAGLPSHRGRQDRYRRACRNRTWSTTTSTSWCSRRRSSASTSCAISRRCARAAASACRCWRSPARR